MITGRCDCAAELGYGLSTCHCGRCHRTFTAISGFDLHQTISEGIVTCHDPLTSCMRDGRPRFSVVRRTRSGNPVWGKEGARPHPPVDPPEAAERHSPALPGLPPGGDLAAAAGELL
jgi:hypothetical protein